MKTLTVTATVLAVLAFSHSHAAGRAKLCKDLRPSVVSIAKARDAGKSQDSISEAVTAAAEHEEASVHHALQTAVALAFNQRDSDPEQFADAFVKRCSAYDGDILP
ncbi:hypothetical protein GCM10011408_28620 [Dyella caseinilytica]|nr:hypothetical protein GCM10011408_28620 [Dyella caseinilytica]